VSSATFAAEPRRVPLAAMLVLATITFTAITTGFMPSGLLPQISEGLNISEPVTGYLAAAYAGVILVTVIPAARLLTRIPRKTLLISLVLAFALSNVLVGLTPNFAAAMGTASFLFLADFGQLLTGLLLGCYRKSAGFPMPSAPRCA
jgi:predicted MFS family arabinose efflux permease